MCCTSRETSEIHGPKVIDFGLAVFAESNVSLTAPNQVVGTPVCMAPEWSATDCQ
ncbi:hypothetical protein OG206_04820 [Streptomyces sp. NBC_01341]|uniref:hypothetical protein n=1 Tax=Streptomyces sp. NBC_01341 TaxID=2903831 RepID=UPI002E143D03|nr:hypothetical protein OG206_04820 [Streptomyces sp. NBC_01341]